MEEYFMWVIYWFICLLIAAGLGLIPANIAKNKGYSFGLWWFYGWMLFIVAIIHVQFIPDKNAQQKANNNTAYSLPNNSVSNIAGRDVAEELKKYNELKEQGIITESEFEEKKAQLLSLM